MAICHQLIALARVLITKPRLLLLDEPFSNLDEINKKIIYKVLQDVGTLLDLTIVLVSHDPAEILSWADKIIVLKDGRFIQQGSPSSIYFQPIDQYVSGLMGEFNYLPEKISALISADKMYRLVRPHEITLSAAGQELPEAIVKQITFHGNYYRFIVNVLGFDLVVYAQHNNFTTSQKVSISICKNEAGFI